VDMYDLNPGWKFTKPLEADILTLTKRFLSYCDVAFVESALIPYTGT